MDDNIIYLLVQEGREVILGTKKTLLRTSILF